MTAAPRQTFGHRVSRVDHGFVVDAWGPDRTDCLTQLARGLTETLFPGRYAGTGDSLPVSITADSDADLVAELVDEIVYFGDTLGLAVVDVSFEPAHGGVDGFFEIVPRAGTEPVGPAGRKLVTRRLQFSGEDSRWFCHLVMGA